MIWQNVICSMYFDRHRQSKCVYNNMLLPAFDSFTPVNAIFTAVYMMGSTHTPGVYQADTWAGLFARGLADRVPKMVHHLLKYPLQFPFTEIKVHALPRAEFPGKHSPLATCLGNVQHSVYHFPQ